MLVLNLLLLIGVVVYAIKTQDWAKNSDETLSGEQLENNLKNHINSSNPTNILFSPDLSAAFNRKEDSVMEPLFAKGNESSLEG
jgi:hypothetical protein